MSAPGLDVVALRRWLDTALPDGVDGPLEATLLAGGRSNPTYAVADASRRWVLRRPPFGHVLPTAHDMGREHRVLTALAGTDVPVPRTVGLCTDEDVLGAPFYVMDRVEGRTLRSGEDTEQLTEPQRAALGRAMVDVLVALHTIDPDEVGLGDWGRPEGYLERQLRRWRRQWDASATRPRPLVDSLLERLGEALPARSATGIVHGDFKVDNVLVAPEDPGRVLALLDWEMSTLGDTLADLGMLLSFWDQPGELHNPISAGSTAWPGFPSREEVLHRYAEGRGTDPEAVEWYVVLADLKLAVILEGIHARHQQGGTVGDGFDDIGDMVDPLLERAHERALASSDRRLRGPVAAHPHPTPRT